MLSGQAEMLNSLVHQLVRSIEGAKGVAIEKLAEIKVSAPLKKTSLKIKIKSIAEKTIPKATKVEFSKGTLPSNDDHRFEDV